MQEGYKVSQRCMLEKMATLWKMCNHQAPRMLSKQHHSKGWWTNDHTGNQATKVPRMQDV